MMGTRLGLKSRAGAKTRIGGGSWVPGDIGYATTSSNTGVQISLVPTPPSIADGEHWLVKAVVWRTQINILDDADGPYIRGLQQYMAVQDNGTNIKYLAESVTVIQVPGAGNNADTINMDYIGGLRLWAAPAVVEDKGWFAEVTIMRGVQSLA